MLTHEEAMLRMGHAVGGVCPFAVNEDIMAYLDNLLSGLQRLFLLAAAIV